MGDFSFSELIVIAVIAIVLYGKDLPSAARKLANLYSKFRRQLTDIKDEIQRQIPPEELNLEAAASYSGTEPPPTPTGLTAVAENTQVRLTWDSAPNATGYTIKRTTSLAEPHMTVASGIEGTSYTDTELAESTTYYFVVSAMNSAGESADTYEVSATTSTAPPSPEAVPPAAAPEAAGNGAPGGATAPAAGSPGDGESPAGDAPPGRKDEATSFSG